MPERSMSPGPNLAAVLQASTLDKLRTRPHDAIVVGGGAAGGFAAMLLAEAGMRVLVLDAGLPAGTARAPLRRFAGSVARRLSTPQGLRFLPPALIPKARRAARILGHWRQPIQTRCYAWEQAPEAFVDDRDCPYVADRNHPFVWIRARMLGGRVAVPGHGRQYYRLGPEDFAPKDELSPRWPLRAGELDNWYALVERHIGLSGMDDGLPWLPDSALAKALQPTPAENTIQKKIAGRWPHARPILGRYAPPLDALEAAAATGNLLCRQGAVARAVRVDHTGKVSGVVWVDHRTGTEQQSSAPSVFLCASALESTRLLMLSQTPRSPDGLGFGSGALGHYLMDHTLLSAEGTGPKLAAESPSEQGRCMYLPRFDGRDLSTPEPGRGFGVQLHHSPGAGGRSYVVAVSFGEMLPRKDNRVALDSTVKDAWGIPALRIECSHGEAETIRIREQKLALSELMTLLGVSNARIPPVAAPPGSAVHECGTARMGNDPANSVLDSDNQCWDARGLYVTDGACFPSQGYQNPTLTILALTARACAHALRNNGGELADRQPMAKPRRSAALSAADA
jgi:choline dehydrogenase-like flavoprotein